MTVVKPKSKSSSSSSSSSSPKKIIPLQNPFEFENDFNEEIKPELEKSEESESEGKPEVKESKEEKFNRRKPDIGEGYMKGHKAAELKEAELELGGAAIYILGSGDGTTAVKREGLTASMNMQFNRQAKGTFHKIEIEEEQKEEEQKEEGRKKEGQKKEGQKMSLGIELTGDNEEFIFFLKIGEKIYKDSRQICKYQLPPATPTQSREVSRIKGQVVKGPSLLKFDIENKENFYKRYTFGRTYRSYNQNNN